MQGKLDDGAQAGVGILETHPPAEGVGELLDDGEPQAVAAGLEPVDEAKAILRDLAASTELRAILDRLNASSRKLDDSGDWNSTTGHRIDSAMGYLRMALEAAEGR